MSAETAVPLLLFLVNVIAGAIPWMAGAQKRETKEFVNGKAVLGNPLDGLDLSVLGVVLLVGDILFVIGQGLALVVDSFEYVFTGWPVILLGQVVGIFGLTRVLRAMVFRSREGRIAKNDFTRSLVDKVESERLPAFLVFSDGVAIPSASRGAGLPSYCRTLWHQRCLTPDERRLFAGEFLSFVGQGYTNMDLDAMTSFANALRRSLPEYGVEVYEHTHQEERRGVHSDGEPYDYWVGVQDGMTLLVVRKDLLDEERAQTAATAAAARGPELKHW